MKLINEEQLLDQEFRAKVIKEIKSPENVDRKREAKKRHDLYKDKIASYIVKSLEAEGLKPETIVAMGQRASNVNILKKITNKISRTYSGGVERTTGDEQLDEQLDALYKHVKFNEKMRKSDRYREFQKNCMIQYVPQAVMLGQERLAQLAMRVLSPWQYDVIQDASDEEIPKVVILSAFEDRNFHEQRTEAEAGRHNNSKRILKSSNDGVDQTIADNPLDEQGENFIFWSDSYHFTTDEDGKVIHGPENFENPIGILPFVNNADDQDGFFWAEGGNDLTEGTLLINKIMTDMNYIAYLQGYGLYVITGSNLETRFTTGPNNALLLNYDPEKGEERPEVSVISANPPLESWMKMVEQYVALLLTTNNLSPSNISANLTAQNFPSGVAMLIEKSEATDDISDKQNDYKDKERLSLEIMRRWVNLLNEASDINLHPDLQAVGQLPQEPIDLQVMFSDLKPAITEAEKLENLKKRKELGINTKVELIMKDNPDLSAEEAEEKLIKIAEEKAQAVSSALSNAIIQSEPSEEEEDEDGEDN